jgi:hypothetical protein
MYQEKPAERAGFFLVKTGSGYRFRGKSGLRGDTDWREIPV